MRERLAIIPAAGTATRMGGLPKFLLPTIDREHDKTVHSLNPTLLEQHIRYGLDFAEMVIIVTRPENAYLMKSFLVPNKVEVLVMETKSMTETVIRTARVCNAAENIILMPDTYFTEGFNSSSLALEGSEVISLGLWKIRPEQVGSVGQIECHGEPGLSNFVRNHSDKDPDCEFPFLWGAMNISSAGINLLDEEMPHVGYLISKLLDSDHSRFQVGARFQSGQYIDCGTMSGYFNHLLL